VYSCSTQGNSHNFSTIILCPDRVVRMPFSGCSEPFTTLCDWGSIAPRDATEAHPVRGLVRLRLKIAPERCCKACPGAILRATEAQVVRLGLTAALSCD